MTCPDAHEPPTDQPKRQRTEQEILHFLNELWEDANKRHIELAEQAAMDEPDEQPPDTGEGADRA